MAEGGNEKINLQDETIKNMFLTVGSDNTTHLFCRIDWIDINSKAKLIKKQDILTSQKNKHAEELLIEDLNEMNPSLMTTITIYMNDSPCSNAGHNCAKKLINFLNENTNIVFILYVTNLHNIQRVSCKGEWHYSFASQADNKANVTGLKNLMEHGRCVVSAFSYAIWSELLNIVPVSEEFRSQLLKGYSKKLNGNDRSQEDKDDRIRSDLIWIRYVPCVFQ